MSMVKFAQNLILVRSGHAWPDLKAYSYIPVKDCLGDSGIGFFAQVS
jgi:hypothetical protein